MIISLSFSLSLTTTTTTTTYYFLLLMLTFFLSIFEESGLELASNEHN